MTGRSIDRTSLPSDPMSNRDESTALPHKEKVPPTTSKDDVKSQSKWVTDTRVTLKIGGAEEYDPESPPYSPPYSPTSSYMW